jgi:hypothetical protein
MPDGMRERIRAAAESNDRSMNAEIVATLEEKYPAPSPLYVRDEHTDLYMGVLHWSEDRKDWRTVDWDVWKEFRSLDKPKMSYPGFPEGDNYFFVLVFDGNDDIRNIIPHFYRLDRQGNVVGTAFDVLTQEEQKEFKRMMIGADPKPSDDRYYSELCAKMNPYLRPPSYTISILRNKILSSSAAPSLDKLLKEREFI